MKTGDKVFPAKAVVGDPGCILKTEGVRALVEWPDMPEEGRFTWELLSDLVIDQSITQHGLPLEIDSAAA